MLTPELLRQCALSWSLFRPTNLKQAVERLGFIQADPIRSPARAQDLILRHRVKGYRAGDLERRYAALGLEEDFLYVYGFFPPGIWQLLQARNGADLSDFEKRVLEKVQGADAIHPRELDVHFGRERIENDWGGFSIATKRALEHLHRRGFLRVVRREKGIRVYARARKSMGVETPVKRYQKLLMMVINLLAPVVERTLTGIAARLRRWFPEVPDHRFVIQHLMQAGVIERQKVEGATYLWPAEKKIPRPSPPAQVRFLAPFDPVVWDRPRFEHLWGWPYRFEAYTPPAKRLRGYYAMPLLWGTRVIGWANAKVAAGKLQVELGFVDKRPRERAFPVEAEAEIERLRVFLRLKETGD